MRVLDFRSETFVGAQVWIDICYGDDAFGRFEQQKHKNFHQQIMEFLIAPGVGKDDE